MLSIHRPSDVAVRNFLDTQVALRFTYAEFGATQGSAPAGYRVDHTRVRLGSGRDVFVAACEALKRWRQFQLGWLEARPTDTPIAAGETVAVAAHLLGFWWLNAARIVYAIDECDSANGNERFGFAYGTLPSHIERGEERFLVQRDPIDGSVWYDILAFSRPRHVLAHLGYPYVRHTQKRFGRDSAAAMLRAVAERPLSASMPGR